MFTLNPHRLPRVPLRDNFRQNFETANRGKGLKHPSVQTLVFPQMSKENNGPFVRQVQHEHVVLGIIYSSSLLLARWARLMVNKRHQ